MFLIEIGKRLCTVIFLVQVILISAQAPMTEWNSLLKSNDTFVRNNSFAKQRNILKNGQNPPVIVLSCSDSRVPPELIFDKGLGSLFVVRLAGQVIDNVAIDSIEYAVKHFDSRVIVVLGHSDCGAVSGALEHLQKNNGAIDQSRGGYLNAVLIPIETAITQAHIDIHGKNAQEEAIQANVRFIADQLISRSSPISQALNKGQIIVVGAEYFIDTGKVNQLFITSQQQLIRKSVNK